MASSVSPNSSVWSSPIEVTPAASGSTTLVESSRPPSPVSTTATSAPAAREVVEGHGCSRLEERRTDPLDRRGPARDERRDLGRGDRHARDDDALAEVDEVRRSVGRDAPAAGREQRHERRHRAPLPVRTGDVEQRTARCGSPSSASSARVRPRPYVLPPPVRANR
jgi:hypothetical protein